MLLWTTMRRSPPSHARPHRFPPFASRRPRCRPSRRAGTPRHGGRDQHLRVDRPTPGVMIGTHALTAATAQVHSRVDGEPIWIIALSPTSIGGLNVMIRAHDTGIRPIAVRSIGGAEPFTDDAFAAAVRDATATGRPIAVSLVPSQVTFVRQRSGAGVFAPVLPHLGRGRTRRSTTHEPLPGRRHHPDHDLPMTETSGGCVFDGRPLDGVEVRIDDADSRVCISGPMLAQGIETERRAFDGHWLRTNDRGS